MARVEIGSEFLGRGWAFPPRFGPRGCEAQMVSAERDIEQSLWILLSTRPGERVMRPDFGCGIHALVFEVMSEAMFGRVEESIERAILYFEHRVTFDGLHIDTSDVADGLLRLHIDYTIRETNSRANIVYPFYLSEGTSVGPSASPDPGR